jgi:hypothetical protein
MPNNLQFEFKEIGNMNKYLRVSVLRGVILGLGISCASAASVVSLNPQTVELHPGSSQSVKIMMDSVPKGLSGSNIIISVSINTASAAIIDIEPIPKPI